MGARGNHFQWEGSFNDKKAAVDRLCQNITSAIDTLIKEGVSAKTMRQSVSTCKLQGLDQLSNKAYAASLPRTKGLGPVPQPPFQSYALTLLAEGNYKPMLSLLSDHMDASQMKMALTGLQNATEKHLKDLERQGTLQPEKEPERAR